MLSVLFSAMNHSCTKIKFDLDPSFDDSEGSNAGECNVLNTSYEETIIPILQDHCIGCHNSISPAAGYDYSDYDHLIRSVADGSLLGTVERQVGFSAMPPDNPLDNCAVRKIKAWIETLDLDSIPEYNPSDDDGNISSCHPDTVYFQNTILPLVVSSCATTKCHDEVSHRHGIILTDYESIIKTGKIKPGDPGDSEFFESLTDDGDDLMPPPPYKPLDNEQIMLIKQWILQGARDNSCNDGCDTSDVTFTATIWPMMQQYCTGCHSTANPGGGIVIGSYNDLVNLAGNGSLMGSVRYEEGYANMPTNKPLSDCHIHLLQKWIDRGMPE